MSNKSPEAVRMSQNHMRKITNILGLNISEGDPNTYRLIQFYPQLGYVAFFVVHSEEQAQKTSYIITSIRLSHPYH
jgi:hypothetical protein